jgi:excisionase family DNA binding protein
VRQPETADDKLSLLQAAPLLGVSPFTLRAWVRERRVPFYRLGRRIVFSRADLTEFLAAARIPARDEAAR